MHCSYPRRVAHGKVKRSKMLDPECLQSRLVQFWVALKCVIVSLS